MKHFIGQDDGLQKHTTQQRSRGKRDFRLRTGALAVLGQWRCQKPVMHPRQQSPVTIWVGGLSLHRRYVLKPLRQTEDQNAIAHFQYTIANNITLKNGGSRLLIRKGSSRWNCQVKDFHGCQVIQVFAAGQILRLLPMVSRYLHGLHCMRLSAWQAEEMQWVVLDSNRDNVKRQKLLAWTILSPISIHIVWQKKSWTHYLLTIILKKYQKFHFGEGIVGETTIETHQASSLPFD